ncbi:hypothetical protein [Virgibacillus pantothenticus]|uniref:hypothetical protein n=1 Tax=Virgibacillus pantothenticus TaxID=1473 RepID=UPI001BAFD3D0|nr:hypothetical protein [Virgibacillus pantothenticus]
MLGERIGQLGAVISHLDLLFCTDYPTPEVGDIQHLIYGIIWLSFVMISVQLLLHVYD